METPRESTPGICNAKTGTRRRQQPAHAKKWADCDLEAFAAAKATSKNIGHRKSARTQTFQPGILWDGFYLGRSAFHFGRRGASGSVSWDKLGLFLGSMRNSDPAPKRKVSARLRSPPHIPKPADDIATRSHLPLLTGLLAMPFVVFPPPSHKLHLGSPRGGDGTRSRRERADRRTGTSLPSSARVRQATCPSNVLPYLVTRIGPGLPASLSSQPKQSLLTGREVRAAKRRRPLHLEGGQHAPHVGGPISSKSRYAPAD